MDLAYPLPGVHSVNRIRLQCNRLPRRISEDHPVTNLVTDRTLLRCADRRTLRRCLTFLGVAYSVYSRRCLDAVRYMQGKGKGGQSKSRRNMQIPGSVCLVQFEQSLTPSYLFDCPSGWPAVAEANEVPAGHRQVYLERENAHVT